ncbi:MAG TPA: hypothetical protein VHE82_09405, partial [Gemmatimonadaceae bacterium]|nr:hypothetical protein [Gemmatimonadaceae bacterium]
RQIESRAIRYGTPDGKLGTHPVDRFSRSGAYATTEDGTHRPSLVMEGYLLDTGEFVYRGDIRGFFPLTDICWDAANTVNDDELPYGPGAA